MKHLLHSIAAAVLVLPILAGPYPPAAGQPGSDAVAASDDRFVTWASEAQVMRGPTEIGFEGSSLASYGSEIDATLSADASPDSPYPVVSLGDGGSATLAFSQPFGDMPGPDFAVFENGFTANFLELAHVEVSSDGVNFFRFPSYSLTASSANIGEGGAVDPTNIHNLAGKYLAGFGTPFDLSQLRNASPQLDLQRITHVRVIDVVGTNDPALGSLDASGNLVIDPYPTPFFSSGFDLDAVGAFSATATTFAAWKTAQGIQGNQPATDSNQNGLADLVEYVTGTGVIQLSRSGGETRIEFPRLSYRSGGNLRVESSTDLIHWSTLATSIDGGPVTSDRQDVLVTESGVALKWVTLRLPLIAGPGYYRLAAMLTPTP
jgi:hypothetical protein